MCMVWERMDLTAGDYQVHRAWWHLRKCTVPRDRSVTHRQNFSMYNPTLNETSRSRIWPPRYALFEDLRIFLMSWVFVRPQATIKASTQIPAPETGRAAAHLLVSVSFYSTEVAQHTSHVNFRIIGKSTHATAGCGCACRNRDGLQTGSYITTVM